MLPSISSTRRISIHALRTEGDGCAGANQQLVQISIHALRTEGDALRKEGADDCIYFYPRPPYGGRPGNTL